MMLASSTLPVPHVAYSVIGPEVVMVVGALVLLTIAALRRSPLPHAFTTSLTCSVAVVSLVWSLHVWSRVVGAGKHGFTAVDSAIAVDGFSALILVLVSVALFLSALASASFLRRESMEGPEFAVLLMLSSAGAMLMGAANDLIVLFLGLEIMSIALYVLAGSNLRRRQSGEAAIKYFVLGAFSSAIFLYGIALVYGATGSTNLSAIATFLTTSVIVHNGVLLAGMAFLLVGLGFKVAAVPFHTWAPDVYQGAPTPAVSFMAAVAKAGGFAGLLRVVYSTLGTLQIDWKPVIWALAVLSLVVGAVLAVVQRDVKRMLAYSSVSHAGFVLIGLAAASGRGIAGSLYYLFAYTFMVIGAFTVAQVVSGTGDSRHDLEDYRGLIRRQPFLAIGMSVFLLAQAGVPFTTGFLAKFSVVSAVAEAHSYALAVIAMVSAAIAAFFYLRVVGYMFSTGTGGEASAVVQPGAGTASVRFSVGDAPSAAPLPAFEHSAAAVAVMDEEVVASVGTTPALAEAPAAPLFAGVPFGPAVVIALSGAVTVVFGIWAQPLLDFARHATLLF